MPEDPQAIVLASASPRRSELLGRVGIDFLRPVNPFLLGLGQAQVIGIIVLVITIPVLVRRRPWLKTETQQQ